MKEKSLQIVSLLLIFFSIVILPGCRDAEKSDFKRIVFSNKERSLDKFGEVLFSYSGKNYLNLKQSSFPVSKFGRSIEMKNDLKNSNRVYLTLYCKHWDRVSIKKDNVLIETRKIRRGFNEFSIELKYGESLKLTMEKNKDVWFSEPVLYRYGSKERKLVFLIIADTLGAKHIDIYNPAKNTSPNISELAKDSALFLNSISSSSYTPSSHMSIFTSQYAFTHGVRVRTEYFNGKRVDDEKFIVPLAEDVRNLAENLSEKFIMISYNGGGNVCPQFGFFRGFNLWRGFERDITDPRASEQLFMRAKRNLEKNKFLNAFYFLHTYHLHAPYKPGKEFVPELKEGGFNSFDFNKDLGGVKALFHKFNDSERKNILELYEGEIRSFDKYLGDFIKYLKEKGLYESSMIVVTSDHGEEFNEHGSWTHATSLYNEQIKVPLIIKFPFQKYKNKRINDFVGQIDILPTLLDYYKIDAPKEIRGVSLLKYLEEEQIPNRTILSSLYLCKPFMMVPGKISLINNGFKLIFNEKRSPFAKNFFTYPIPYNEGFELYNIVEDPDEKHDIFNSNLPIKDSLVNEMLKIIKIYRILDKNSKNGIQVPDDVKKQLKTLGYM